MSKIENEGMETLSEQMEVESGAPEVTQRIRDVVDLVRRIAPVGTSAYLSGSFGRGEGSFLLTDNGRLPIKDLDFIVVTPRHMGTRRQAMKTALHHALDPEEVDRPDGGRPVLITDVAFMSPRTLRLLPDLSMVDFKENSSILLGHDVRPSVPWTAEDVPFTCCLRYLMEKHVGLIELAPNRAEEMSAHAAAGLRYECAKTYVEMGTCIVHSLGHYTPSYRTRMNWLADVAHRDAILAWGVTDDLLKQIVRCHIAKLSSDFSGFGDLFLQWQNTSEDLASFLNLFLSNATPFRPRSIPLDPHEFESFLSKFYFSTILRAVLHKYTPKLASVPIARGAALLFQARLIAQSNRRHITKLTRLRLPSILHVYAVAPITLNSMARGDAQDLDTARNYLSALLGRRSAELPGKAVLSLYRSYKGLK